jgi:PAS domain S-box-containing protein
LLASIVDSSGDAIIGKSLDGTIISWNKAAEHIYGYTAEEIIGKSITLLAPPGRKDEIPKILDRLRHGERIEHLDTVRVTKDARQLNVSVTISPIRDARGTIIGASAIARDVTAILRTRQILQEAESRAHALFQAATQAIIVVDRRGRVVMANPATEKLFGFQADELAGQTLERLLPQRLDKIHVKHRDGFFKNPQTRPMGMGMDLQARRKDGSEFFAEISLTYIAGAEGTLAVAFVTDVSKRRADEQVLRHQREDLRTLAVKLMTAQDDERRRIARNLHDDLSQSLAFVAMDLGKLANKPVASDLTQELRSLQRRAAEAAENVRRISHELHPSILDDIGLTAALEQYCSEFQERSGIVTHFDSNDVPETLASSVSNSIYHIAQECLRNVAKHSRAEEVFVVLDSIDGVLRLTVKDHGVGLSPEMSATGKGIGIVGMRERAHLVNGNISIRSSSGKGTEVNVEVPITAEA